MKKELDIFREYKCDFCMSVQDNGFAPQIVAGDTVLVHTQSEVSNGDIHVILMGEQALLRRISHNQHGLILTVDNPQIAPIIIESNEIKQLRILGVATAVLHKLTAT